MSDEPNELADVTLADLYLRVNILRQIIREAEAEGDPRVINPQTQLEILEAELTRRGADLYPKAVVIGLKPLELKGQRL